MKKIYYASNGNPTKFKEIQDLMAIINTDLCVEEYKTKLTITQNSNIETIATNKALDAYKRISRPVFVEHTGLQLPKYGNMPDGQTAIYWKQLLQKANSLSTEMMEEELKIVHARTDPDAETKWYRSHNQKAAELFCKLHKSENAIAKSVLAYCDGKKVQLFSKNISGKIVSDPDGDSLFEWDCVFSPDTASGKTLARLNEIKDKSCPAGKEHPTKKDIFFSRLDVLKEFSIYLNDTTADNLPDVIPAGQDSLIQELKNKIAAKKIILFIGSGLSYSFKLPDWAGLIKVFSPFNLSERGARNIFENLEKNRLPALAEYCADGNNSKIHDVASKWMIDNWNDRIMAANFSEQCKKIYSGIYNLDCPYIYTTNYDQCLEFAFSKLFSTNRYKSVVTLQDICQLKAEEPAIYKFHGDMSVPSSIILTESDYFRRMNFEDCMDLRLRSDLMQYSFLFLGYSLADTNLRYLLYRLSELRKSYGTTDDLKSYIFMTTPNPAEMSIFKNTFHVETIISETIDHEKETIDFLEKLKP